MPSSLSNSYFLFILDHIFNKIQQITVNFVACMGNKVKVDDINLGLNMVTLLNMTNSRT